MLLCIRHAWSAGRKYGRTSEVAAAQCGKPILQQLKLSAFPFPPVFPFSHTAHSLPFLKNLATLLSSNRPHLTSKAIAVGAEGVHACQEINRKSFEITKLERKQIVGRTKK